MGFFKYLFRYSVRDMADFLRNEKRDPEDFPGTLAGKTALITGATSGIGLVTARLFASRGANLVLVNRNPERSASFERELGERYGVSVRTVLCDFSCMAAVKACAAELLALPEPLDVLVLNAGVYYTARTFTPDGLETVFQVNHLAPFALNYLLRERLRKEGRARILYVNSEGHRFALAGVHLDDLEWRRHRYTGLKGYGAAKTAQLLTMKKFAAYFAGSGVTVNAMHPGNVRTRIGENNGALYRWFKNTFVLASARDPEISAKALLFLAGSKSLSGVSGAFFNLTSQELPAPHGRDDSRVEETWAKSLELCGLS